MIISSLKDFGRYFGLNPLFEEVSRFILNNELKEFAIGEYEIAGRDLYVIIAAGQHDESYKPRLEAHRKYIDIQAALEGDFDIAWRAVGSCHSLSEPYSGDSDYELYSDQAEIILRMLPGTLCILFPEDAHVALTPEVTVKKAIFKIAINP
jgi:biofilm protein TabA